MAWELAHNDRELLLTAINRLDEISKKMDTHSETHRIIDCRLARMERFMWAVVGISGLVVVTLPLWLRAVGGW